jgi:phage repressor protein C with HTH and peptisase S24 domain
MAWRLNSAADEANLKQIAIAERLGEKPATVGNWFQGLNYPRRRTRQALAQMLKVSEAWLFEGSPDRTPAAVDESPEEYTADTALTAVRQVPVISWTHAGSAANFEAMPKHWQGHVATTSRDRKAFGVVVEGDCMVPKYLPGDILIIEPTSEPRNSKPVVAKLTDDGVQVRIYTKMPGGKIRLATLKPEIYPTLDHSPRDFHWIWPVAQMVRNE